MKQYFQVSRGHFIEPSIAARFPETQFSWVKQGEDDFFFQFLSLAAFTDVFLLSTLSWCVPSSTYLHFQMIKQPMSRSDLERVILWFVDTVDTPSPCFVLLFFNLKKYWWSCLSVGWCCRRNKAGRELGQMFLWVPWTYNSWTPPKHI